MRRVQALSVFMYYALYKTPGNRGFFMLFLFL